MFINNKQDSKITAVNQWTFKIDAKNKQRKNWIMKFSQILVIFATILSFLTVVVTCRKILYIKGLTPASNSSKTANMLKSPYQGVQCTSGFLPDPRNGICRRSINWNIAYTCPQKAIKFNFSTTTQESSTNASAKQYLI